MGIDHLQSRRDRERKRERGAIGSVWSCSQQWEQGQWWPAQFCSFPRLSSVWILLPSWLCWTIQMTDIWSLVTYKNGHVIRHDYSCLDLSVSLDFSCPGCLRQVYRAACPASLHWTTGASASSFFDHWTQDQDAAIIRQVYWKSYSLFQNQWF